MTTGAIIAIVVIAIIVIALLMMIPRMRARSVERRRMRELESRRTAEAERHRGEASERERRADVAEQKARMAQQAAERERADARLHEERATMHERGMADDELIGSHEREDFAGVAGTEDRPAEDTTMRRGTVDENRADEGRFEREERPVDRDERIER